MMLLEFDTEHMNFNSFLNSFVHTQGNFWCHVIFVVFALETTEKHIFWIILKYYQGMIKIASLCTGSFWNIRTVISYRNGHDRLNFWATCPKISESMQSCIESEILKGVALKLCLPRPFLYTSTVLIIRNNPVEGSDWK